MSANRLARRHGQHRLTVLLAAADDFRTTLARFDDAAEARELVDPEAEP